MIWLLATIVAMLLLAYGKLMVGRPPARRGANTLFGWWWADPLASLVIVAYGTREGRAALRHAPAVQ